jgi:NADP-dependent 3-hydroxy acid dehydrogenase YdfG
MAFPQVAVVTGAASGIGAALARALAARGSELVLADRSEALLREVAAQLGARARVTDVADAGDMERLAETAGAADLVCLNAGVTSLQAAPVWETPLDEWHRLLDVNLGGVFHGLRAFVPRMLADGRPHRLLITASLAGLATWPGGGAYAASKHAVVTLAEQAALSLQGTPVSVTVLCPALVRSGMSPVGREPDEVAVEALAAVDAGEFLVVPEEWRDAVRRRGERLAVGAQPELPVPTSGKSS